ncbi:MAG TPA: J domain-containing protein [Gammaproteobacteria bacterium]|jgi:hypothetical protein|nr:J domain-containing protein [Gammaproteobacteria bacterium]
MPTQSLYIESHFYKTLNLTPSCAYEEIKKNFRKLALQYHPDKAKNEREIIEYTEKFKKIRTAYEYLLVNHTKCDRDNEESFGDNEENLGDEIIGDISFAESMNSVLSEDHFKIEPVNVKCRDFKKITRAFKKVTPHFGNANFFKRKEDALFKASVITHLNDLISMQPNLKVYIASYRFYRFFLRDLMSYYADPFPSPEKIICKSLIRVSGITFSTLKYQVIRRPILDRWMQLHDEEVKNKLILLANPQVANFINNINKNILRRIMKNIYHLTDIEKDEMAVKKLDYFRRLYAEITNAVFTTLLDYNGSNQQINNPIELNKNIKNSIKHAVKYFSSDNCNKEIAQFRRHTISDILIRLALIPVFPIVFPLLLFKPVRNWMLKTRTVRETKSLADVIDNIETDIKYENKSNVKSENKPDDSPKVNTFLR